MVKTMSSIKSQTVTQLRSSLFQTFESVAAGEIHHITHKNGSQAAIVPMTMIQELQDEIELHKNLAIGYAQALRGEGKSSAQMLKSLEKKQTNLLKKFG